MLTAYDAKQLEWRAVAHLSEDKVALEEVKDSSIDFHSDNQARFKLPSRLVAKVFLFRNIYCPWWNVDKTAYAYSVDNDFKHVGGRKFWRDVIDKFYTKYDGIYQYHKKLKSMVTSNGYIENPTGRIYEFEPKIYNGEIKWPDNDIVNYPVQGFSADLMQIIRISAFNRLKEYREQQRCLFVNTVHDNLVLDINGNIHLAKEISEIVKGSFQDCGKNYQKLYGKELLVPMDCDAKVGINYLWMHEIKL